MRLRIIFINFLLVFLILIGIWGFFIEPNLIKIEKISLKIKDLPSSFENIKIAHLTDLHSKKFGKKEEKILKILAQLNPDFIFITGDIIDWETYDFESCQRFWKALSKDYQGRIFGVYGNHEHRNRNFRKLNDFFRESQIEILNNESRKLIKKGDFIYLIGVDDPHLGYDDLEKAMEKVKEDAPRILLAHSPEIFRKVKDKNIDLVLVGHTHGGQINLPILGNLILPLKYDKKYKRGLFFENSTYMYVNRGIGETFLPIRINSFPEIILIKLISK